MTIPALAYQWSRSEFVRAFEAGVYWVVTEECIFEHSGPTASGYRQRTEYRRGDRIPVGYAGVELAVDDLL